MSIERLIYTNRQGESIEFSHAGLYFPTQIIGLSDIRSTLYTSNSMGQSGDTFLGSRIESREIEIQGSIRERNREKAVEYRRKLTHVLNPQLQGQLRYEYGDFVRIIDCRVDSSPVFTKKSILQDFTVQLYCPNPFWREEKDKKVDIAAWLGSMEFELEIPDNGSMELGYREPSLIMNVYNEGDVETGLRLEMRAMGTVLNPSILNVDTQEYIKINLLMVAGDILTVSTNYGRKEVSLLRNGMLTDGSQYFDPDGSFLQLQIGDNLLRYDAEDNLSNLEVSIYYSNSYLGV